MPTRIQGGGSDVNPFKKKLRPIGRAAQVVGTLRPKLQRLIDLSTNLEPQDCKEHHVKNEKSGKRENAFLQKAGNI